MSHIEDFNKIEKVERNVELSHCTMKGKSI